MPRFELSTQLPFPAAQVWDWHARPGALERLVPPWGPLHLDGAAPPLAEGARVQLEGSAAMIPVRMTSTIQRVTPGSEFVDVQSSGPFDHWAHTHRIAPTGQGCELTDHVEYQPPFGKIGEVVSSFLLAPEIERSFRWRHRRLADDLARHAPYRDRPRLRVAVTGASGAVGRALCAFLTTGGHTVHPLVRRSPRPGEIRWDPANATVDTAALEGVDAVVHLAGEPVSQRWTDDARRRIRDSRVQGTRVLAKALAGLERKPRVLVSASAVGFWGHQDQPVDESSPAGQGFLAQVAQAWEEAADPARAAGIRVAHPRIGVVLDGGSGALPAMLPAFRIGLGGPIGSGHQGFPWILIDDLVGLLHQAIQEEAFVGPFAAVSPEPCSQGELAKALGRVLRRPAFLPTPAAVIETLMGPMGRGLLLEGARVHPEHTRRFGGTWRYPKLDEALRFALGR